VPVAIRLPAELVVMIELAANVVADITCEASVEVETTLNSPLDPTYPYPCPEPTLSCVVDAYPNEASVVEVLENVLSAVKTLDVYVFGIVVLELMNELMFVFRNDVSRVSAPPVLTRPAPSRLLNV
jgi:hypothetical protein